MNPLHEKRTSPFKKLDGKQKVAHVSRTFANNRHNGTIEMHNCIVFELQSAPNLHREKNTSFELQSAPKVHRDKKTNVFELQSSPNLHRDKKTKKNKNFTIYLGRGKYPSKDFFLFFVPVQVWCTLKLKPCVCFVPVEVWCDSSRAAFRFDMCLRNQ